MDVIRTTWRIIVPMWLPTEVISSLPVFQPDGKPAGGALTSGTLARLAIVPSFMMQVSYTLGSRLKDGPRRLGGDVVTDT